jgi:hypothetical protein
MPLTTITNEELPMAKDNIDASPELLNRLDNELIALTKLMFDAQGIILVLKFISKRLREDEGDFTKH